MKILPARVRHAIEAPAIEVASSQEVTVQAKVVSLRGIVHKPLMRVRVQVEGMDIDCEVLLAEPLPAKDNYRIVSIPAFAYGLAPGDTIHIPESNSGTYKILSRGGQIVIRTFVNGGLERPDIKNLINSITQINGKYEIGKNDENSTSLLLLSLDIQAGFAKIESMLHTVEGPDVKWEYGNIYDAEGKPLNWWAH